MKLNEQLLQSIKAGQPVDLLMIPGHIGTPKMPIDIFDFEYNPDGSEFKRTVNPERWINWLKTVAENSADPEADMTTKSIVGTKFHDNCFIAHRTIKSHIKNINNTVHSGTYWIENGQHYSIPLVGEEQIVHALMALQQVNKNSIEPISNSFLYTAKNTKVINYEQEDDIMDIVRGADN